MLILNSGGTFNKKYNPLNGELEVLYNNSSIEKILQSVESKYDLAGVIYKDSLDMNMDDRKMLAKIIMESKDDTFIVVHGTDTMHMSAEFLSEIFEDRKIVFVGAMKPFEIDTIEASFNLGMAMGFAKALKEYGVYICMNGYVEPWKNIQKNTKFGKFEVVS
ncbi:MAG: asparaginase [Sulfurimonas sp. RIFOXYB2_FULL_37_5]|uniref:asparaginase domain-containing protein n=1 Tax=unclassified Sulfurimonas TaxID=2623549 RepID=UPI0008D0B2B4|nr:MULTISPECIES: asparaginase domain-containing protein [unclassified Sulfurimonas]OHE08562.1 MAG: asparaginase [Sulfurimonas sp. RIFOXYC2_FULL_36_7]OHE15161.1 MAG: asparaginase [Sulfurimonas sp. RIFOXYB2_FULL_37_5]MBS4067906.1 asparaginase [Sulfurimonas sp.]MDD3856356.1 asparaginase domain-containing protein [Sulfurimonas sp.]OHE03493.1 MAG: asparaginase [Sulfurimonas sp. RIFOXYB12_FULL_35_9]